MPYLNLIVHVWHTYITLMTFRLNSFDHTGSLKKLKNWYFGHSMGGGVSD